MPTLNQYIINVIPSHTLLDGSPRLLLARIAVLSCLLVGASTIDLVVLLYEQLLAGALSYLYLTTIHSLGRPVGFWLICGCELLLKCWITNIRRTNIDLGALDLCKRKYLRVVRLALRSLDCSHVIRHVRPLHHLRLDIAFRIIQLFWLRLQVPLLALVRSTVSVDN